MPRIANEDMKMTNVIELKATIRPSSGKGAARAVRRAGAVPGVIYGDKQAPLSIAIDAKELTQRIYAGHFLTTIYSIDVEGKKHRVIPRDFHLDPVRDFPVHVDFLRIGAGTTVRVNVPLHVKGADVSPGVKRGGTVNIVTHNVELECPPESIPQFIEIDVTTLEINHSVHLNDIELPKGVRTLTRATATLVTIVPPSGYGEEAKPAEAGAAPAAAAPAAAAGGDKKK